MIHNYDKIIQLSVSQLSGANCIGKNLTQQVFVRYHEICITMKVACKWCNVVIGKCSHTVNFVIMPPLYYIYHF